MSLFSVTQQAERGAPYSHRSVMAMVALALASFGLNLRLAISLPGSAGLPALIAVLPAGFLLPSKLVKGIVSRKFPAGEDF
jgi:hypothetical protein